MRDTFYDNILVLRLYDYGINYLYTDNDVKIFQTKNRSFVLCCDNNKVNFSGLCDVKKRIENIENDNYDKKYDIYVINLENRKNRYNDILKELHKLNIFNIHIYKAIKNYTGHLGCELSYLNLIKYAMK